MLATIDQWAFQFLMIAISFFGVQQIPSNPDPDWKINEAWTELPGQFYRTTLESHTVITKCVSNPEYYLVFPQVYMGIQEVYLGDKLIYSNSPLGNWKLETIFDRPIISCRAISGDGPIKFINVSYMRYYNSINNYPELAKVKPRSQPFYNVVYLLSAAICLSLCIVGALLIRLLNPKENIYSFIFLGLFCSGIMYTHVPGYIFSIESWLNHTLIFGGLMGMTVAFLYPIELQYWRRKNFTALCIFLIFATIFTTLSKNVAQAMMIPFCVVAIVFIFKVSISRRHFAKSERFFMIIVFLICVKDFYQSQVQRNGFIHLSLLAVVLVATAFLKVIREINDKRSELILIGAKLQNERILVGKISKLNVLHRQIIHDLKSPITSLDFILKSKQINLNVIALVNQRLSEILNWTEKGDSKMSLDWYSLGLFVAKLDEVISERIQTSSIEIIKSGFEKIDARVELLFDPVELKIIADEIVLNSLKHNCSHIKKLNIAFFENYQQSLIIEFSDNGVMISPSKFDLIGEKGGSDTSSGIGLFGIKRRMEEWGGGVTFENTENGLRIRLSVQARF